ncbi:MAG: lipopolysaccharide biosynthesis protein [Halanaeroarchaeum sp.]
MRLSGNRSEPQRNRVSPDDDDHVPEAERDALLTIVHGAVVTAGGVSGQRALTTAAEIVLARGLGPTAYGVYALAWRLAQLLFRIVTFGSVPALQRYLPAFEDDPARRNAVAGLAYATTVAFGAVIAAAIWLSAPQIDALTIRQPAFVPTMRLFGILVGLLGLVRVSASVLRAVGSARGEVLFDKLLRPAVRFAGALLALWLGYSVVGIAALVVVAVALLVAVAIPLSARMTGVVPSLRGTRREAGRFYNHAAPVALSSLGKIFQNRLDVILVGALLSAVAAGVYNAVLVLIAITWIPLLSFNQLLPPVASDLYADGRTETLNAIYSSVTRLIVTTVAPILATMLVYGRDLLALFGATYTRGYLPLVVYLGGVFVGSAVGATGWLLMMTDHQYVRMLLDWILAVLNAGLTYVFIIRYGLVGAALGTSIAIAVQNGIQVLLLRRFEGLWPFDRTFLTPILAGVAGTVVMVAVRAAIAGPLAIGIGVPTGLLSYLGALHWIGLDPRDRFVVRELAARYRTTIPRLRRS